MGENNREEQTSTSKAGTPQKIGEFWNSHSLADYPENTHEVSLEVDIRLPGIIRDDRKTTVAASDKRTLETV